MKTGLKRGFGLTSFVCAAAVCLLVPGGSAYGACANPANAIEAENCLPGNPSSEWDVAGEGDASIQGFATDISVNRGQTVQFKVDTDAGSYGIDIYRLGYYGGDGARKVASVTPSASLPQSQPACLTNATGLVDCGNWAVSASWAVPANATSGIYIARLVRTDTDGASHIVFVVRADGGSSALLFQTSDTTWQAYNSYGGNSFYGGSGPGGGISGAGRAYKVSYNRPFTTREYAPEDWLFNAEYPMVRWLERNGYDVSYFTGVDADRRGDEIARHAAFLSVGHDEYWSHQQRLNVEQARDQQFPGQAAPVHLAFFSGNEIFWKTRWEPSVDGSSTSHRTLVCYKETHEGAKIDPSPEWTGTWRDPRFSPPADGGRPENGLSGSIFMVNGIQADSIEVPAEYAPMRFWRNTPNVSNLGGGQVWSSPPGMLGYEWDEELDNGFRPAGLVGLSQASVNVPARLLDFGSSYGPGAAVHRLALHKRPSGALVFGAGTIQWPWGLDPEHDRESTPTSVDMQQATVNLFADMGVQPATLQAGLVAATASTDAAPPVSTITSPADGTTVPLPGTVNILGTASDTGGVVGGVEVSVDDGATWHRADGRASWSYAWTPAQSGTFTIRSRAADDSGNLEAPGPGRTIVVGNPPPPPSGPASIWGSGGSPSLINLNDGQPIELGVKFRSSLAGYITALRFYKGDQDTGTHVGSLWSATGALLASAAFSSETTSGWQEVPLASSVPVAADTTYIASYHSAAGYYVVTGGYFTQPFSNGPLTALADGADGGNGVYNYGASAFPAQSFGQSNYWVDIVFSTQASGPDTTPPVVVTTNPVDGATSVAATDAVRARFSEPLAPSTVDGANVQLRDPAAQLVPAAVTWDSVTSSAILQATAALAFSTTYTAVIRGGSGGVTDVAGNPLAGDFTWAFTTQAAPTPGVISIWGGGGTPTFTNLNDGQAIELGVKFRSSVEGYVTGLRFYKGDQDTGSHVGSLWSATGTLLASAAFGSGTPSGWQEAPLASPVLISSNTTYVASYHSSGGYYVASDGYFVQPFTNGPLTALADGTDGPNGLYQYGASGFPTQSFGQSNYWADIIFSTQPPGPDTTPPSVVATTPVNGAVGVPVSANVAAEFSEPLAPSTVNGATLDLRDPAAQVVPATVIWDPAANTAIIDPATALAYSTSYTATVKGGAGGVTDAAGNPLAADTSWTFTTEAPPPPPAGPVSLWGTGGSPSLVNLNDGQPIELGLKFRSALAGYITAIRFYKGSQDTGTHVGNLWSATGTLLATATFTGETASGWQEVPLASPASLAANTTYVVSCHSSAGYYVATDGYFAQPFSNGPLTALANGTDGPNGLYQYGASGFPTQSSGQANYWVDVVFSTQASGPDTTPPLVVATTPPSDATGVTVGSDVSARFSEPMAPSTITGDTFQLRDAAGRLVQASVTWDSTTSSAILAPAAALAYAESFTATVRGGPTGAMDVAGNPLAGDVTWTFTTAAQSASSISIWAGGGNPASTNLNDGQPINSGVKFRSALDGYIIALRFYKGTQDTGTHEGRLWSATGALLGSATFSSETAGGWQQAPLTSPVPISANTTYVASYHSTAGYYVATSGYFVQAFTNGPLTALANGTDGPNGLYQYGAPGFPAQSFGSANYWVDVVFSAQPSAPDTTPPTVVNTTPSNGASGVPVGSNVGAEFSEPLAASTVSATTVELRDAAGQVVPAGVAWDAATNSVIIDPTGVLSHSSAYTATVKGGFSGVTDVAGNPLAADFTWTFTTAAPASGFISIWGDGGTPSFIDLNDGQPVELGVKFRSALQGYITAIRFYKGAQATGTHVGSLWSATGTLLGTATFGSESASGWQQAPLASPVPIAADTTYVASYHSSNGYYSTTDGYLNEPFVNGPLTALADSSDDPNGLYDYGASGFPTQAYAQSNFWVDVVFNAQASGPDTTPPGIVATSPANGTAGVAVGTKVSARFSEPLAPSTVSNTTVQLRDGAARPVPAGVTWDPVTSSVVLDPTAGLAYATSYTATLTGGAGGLTDIAGNPLAADVTWTFTTQPLPPPAPPEGPGGPILVIGYSGNPFSRYVAEILRAEGLNAYKMLDVSSVDATVLSAYDVAILGEMPLSAAQVTMLTDWVNAGGNLIALRPDKQLASLLGLTPTPTTLSNAYLQVDTGAAPGLGIVGQTLQFHGTADRYTLAQAAAVATLYSDAATATSDPAVSLRAVGAAGGEAAAFTFDLARSIVYSRQGNPAWEGQKRDGQLGPIRSDDLYYGAKLGDVQPDWVNLDKVAIPQADELQRLLANLVLHVNRERKPLPRFWYFPRGEKAVVVMTADNHGGPHVETRLAAEEAASDTGCSVADWECIRSTAYVYVDALPDDTTARQWQDKGFEVALHVNTNCANWTPATLADFFTSQIAAYASAFPSLASLTTNRTHCIAWSDWATQPKVELQNGIRLDTNYYYWPAAWVADRPGFFTGSGIPMRFAALDGATIDVYQAATHMTDESGQSYPFTIDTLLDRALGAEGYYGAFTANIHADGTTESTAAAIVASAQARGVPVVTARQLLTWLDGRDGSSFGSVAWNAGTLSFDVVPAAGANGLEAMLPTRAGGSATLATLTRGGAAVSYTTQLVKGVEYAVFTALAGSYQATYASGP